MPPDELAPCRTGSWGWLCSLGVKRWKEWSKALYLRISHRRIPLLFSTLCGSRQISRNRLTQIPFVYFPELNLNFPGAGLFFFFFFPHSSFHRWLNFLVLLSDQMLFWAQLKESHPYTLRSSRWQKSSASFLIKQRNTSGGGGEGKH